MTMTEVKTMAKRVDSGCSNGFGLDIWHFLCHKEKKLTKSISLDDGKVLQVSIDWYPYYEVMENSYGQKFNVCSGLVIPKLHFSVWEESGSFMSSHGLGWCYTISNEPVKRKTVKALQDFTKAYTTEKCMEIWETLKDTKNPMA